MGRLQLCVEIRQQRLHIGVPQEHRLGFGLALALEPRLACRWRLGGQFADLVAHLDGPTLVTLDECGDLAALGVVEERMVVLRQADSPLFGVLGDQVGVLQDHERDPLRRHPGNQFVPRRQRRALCGGGLHSRPFNCTGLGNVRRRIALDVRCRLRHPGCRRCRRTDPRCAAKGLERQQPDQGHVETNLGIRRERQVARADERDLIVDLQVLGRKRPREPVVGRRRIGIEFGGHGQVVECVLHFPKHGGEIERSPGEFVGCGEQRLAVARRQRFEQYTDLIATSDPEHGIHALGFDAAAAVGDRLVGDRQRIAHAAARGTSNRRQGRGFGLHRLSGKDSCELLLDGLGEHVLQVELQTPRQHGDRDLARLGRGQQELHMLRGLFQSLQQGIEAVPGQHVHLIDQVHLEATLAWQELGVREQVAGIVHACPRGRVNFHQVHEPPGGDGLASRTRTARRRRDAGFAIQTRGENAGQRRLAHAAGSGEQIGVMQTGIVESVGEGAYDVLLAHHVRERARTVLSRQHQITHDRRKC